MLFISKKLVLVCIKVLKKNGDGFLTGLTYDAVLEMSRWHLKCEQEGTLEQYTRVVGNGIVDGKL